MEKGDQRPGLEENAPHIRKILMAKTNHGRLARRLTQARFKVMRSCVMLIFSLTFRKLTSRKKVAITPKTTAV